MVLNPDILILDEPTASLDPVTEQAVADSIMHLFKNKTAFIVTHSLALVEKCDLVILLDNEGRATQGTHDELMRTNALYREMFEQSSNLDKRINNYNESAKVRRHEKRIDATLIQSG
jgi:ABC-type multidrug transport system fused ATPase/permease subunit